MPTEREQYLIDSICDSIRDVREEKGLDSSSIRTILTKLADLNPAKFQALLPLGYAPTYHPSAEILKISSGLFVELCSFEIEKILAFTTYPVVQLIRKNPANFNFLSNLYDEGQRDFSTIASNASLAAMHATNINYPDFLANYSDQDILTLQKIPDIVHKLGEIQPNLTLKDIISLCEDNPDKCKAINNFYSNKSGKENAISLEELFLLSPQKIAAIYPNGLVYLNKVISKDQLLEFSSEKIKLLTNPGTIDLLECGIIDIGIIFQSEHDKIKALTSDGAVKLLEDGIIDLRTLSQFTPDKINALTSDGSIELLEHGIIDFEIFSQFEPNKINALTSDGSVRVLRKNPYDLDLLIEIYHEDPDKFKSLTSDKAIWYMENRKLTFTDLSTEYDKNVENFERILDISLNAYKDENKISMRCGAELEVFRGRTQQGQKFTISLPTQHSLPPGWKKSYDESIDPGIEGEEIPTAEYISPIISQENLEGLLFMCSKLNSCGARTNSSCGLHIHLGLLEKAALEDDSDKPLLNKVKQILINYIALGEEGLGFPERDDGMRELGEDDNDIILGAKDLWELGQAADIYEKNATICLSIFTYGTIEFRAHSGTTNPEDILSWMGFIDRLATISQNMIENGVEPHIPSEEELSGLKAQLNILQERNSRVNGSRVEESKGDYRSMVEQEEPGQPPIKRGRF